MSALDISWRIPHEAAITIEVLNRVPTALWRGDRRREHDSAQGGCDRVVERRDDASSGPTDDTPTVGRARLLPQDDEYQGENAQRADDGRDHERRRPRQRAVLRILRRQYRQLVAVLDCRQHQ